MEQTKSQPTSYVPDAIWAQIIGHLKKTEPIPCSMSTVRRDIRQDDLASCMRVSAQLYRITASILYKRVITDCPEGLIIGIDSPPVRSDLDSKLDLLKRIDHLAIEYPELVNPHIYSRIMRAPARRKHENVWKGLAINRRTIFDQVPSYLDTFVGFVQKIINTIRARPLRPHGHNVFAHPQSPFNLETLCFNSVLNGNEVFWSAYVHHASEHISKHARLSHITKFHKAQDMATFLFYLTSPKHFCQRPCGVDGPLALRQLVTKSVPATESSGTIRSHQASFDHATFSPDYHVTLSFESPVHSVTRVNQGDMVTDLSNIGDRLRQSFRETSGVSESDFSKQPFEFSIYLPTKARSGRTRQRQSANGMGSFFTDFATDIVQHELTTAVPGVDLRLSLATVDEAPTCPACTLDLKPDVNDTLLIDRPNILGDGQNGARQTRFGCDCFTKKRQAPRDEHEAFFQGMLDGLGGGSVQFPFF